MLQGLCDLSFLSQLVQWCGFADDPMAQCTLQTDQPMTQNDTMTQKGHDTMTLQIAMIDDGGELEHCEVV